MVSVSAVKSREQLFHRGNLALLVKGDRRIDVPHGKFKIKSENMIYSRWTFPQKMLAVRAI